MDDKKEILKKIRKIEFKVKQLVNSSFAGEYHSQFRGKGMEFDEVKEYTWEDDIRDIDWKVTSRFDKVYVRKYKEERENTSLIVIDSSDSLLFGSSKIQKRELITEIAAIFAFSAIKNRDKVGLIIFNEEIELYLAPKKNESHVLVCIEKILEHYDNLSSRNNGIKRSFLKREDDKKKSSNLEVLTNFIKKVHKKRCMIFFLSDFFFDEGEFKKINYLARKNIFYNLQFCDDLEKKIPKNGLLFFEDIESGKQIIIDSHSKKIREKFEKNSNEYFSKTKRKFNNMKVPHLHLNINEEEYYKKLIAFFRRN